MKSRAIYDQMETGITVSLAISIPESSGFFVSGWSPGETLGQWNESAPGFLTQNSRSLHETANQKKDILFDFPRVSPGDQPLTKKPEDSRIEIVSLATNPRNRKHTKKKSVFSYQGALTIAHKRSQSLRTAI